MKVQKQISESAYRSAGFIGKYQKLIKDTVIPYQYQVLNDKAPDTEKSHVVANFINAGKALRGEDVGDGFYGMVFQDSDAAKWIEAAAYALANFPDEELEKQVDALIDIIADAQDKDGYLDTYFTVKDKEKRWTNLHEAHELYCAGHMAEAACAYFAVTGKRKLLDVMTRNIEHIYKRFVTDNTDGYPGHPEIELALMKMYRVTGNEHCLKLAEQFINTRGTIPDYYKNEREKCGWTVWGANPVDNDYMQAGKPVREQKDATGHAVRAVYLYTGMADLASETGDNTLYEACKTLWDSITKRRMYITGGIGSTNLGEAFSVDYDLPNDTAYCETCASIGLMMFASRMLENEVRAEYADVMERAFYNTVLAGMQLDGKRFFYVNPLEVIPGISGVAPTHRHDLPVRPKWYACACCPPNAARLISSFGHYAYGENDNTVFCHLYAAGTVKFSNGMKITCETNYPYDMKVKYIIEGKGNVAIRIPGWSRNNIFFSDTEKAVRKDHKDGYCYFEIKDNTEIDITFAGSPYLVYASPRVPRLTGMAALCRGPLVYCFEGVDNDGSVTDLSLKKDGELKTAGYDYYLLDGTVTITAEALRTAEIDGLYTTELSKAPVTAKAVPYYTWGNRGENQMRVWMNIT